MYRHSCIDQINIPSIKVHIKSKSEKAFINYNYDFVSIISAVQRKEKTKLNAARYRVENGLSVTANYLLWGGGWLLPTSQLANLAWSNTKDRMKKRRIAMMNVMDDYK